MGQGKIKLSDTIHFEEPQRGSTPAVHPRLELEVGAGPFEAVASVPMTGRFHWPGPGGCELVEFMVHVSGTRVLDGVVEGVVDKGPRPFAQVAEAAHTCRAEAGEVLTIPVVWRVPEGAVAGDWKIAARVGLEGGAVFSAEVSFVVR